MFPHNVASIAKTQKRTRQTPDERIDVAFQLHIGHNASRTTQNFSVLRKTVMSIETDAKFRLYGSVIRFNSLDKNVQRLVTPRN